MTQEKQRIAIATACGWTEISMRCMWGLPPFAIDCGTEDCLKHLPDYINDLNDCHEAEKALSTAQLQREYADILDDGNGGHFATAPQRCKAFLRVMGLWEKEQEDPYHKLAAVGNQL